VAVQECLASCVHRSQSSAYDLAVNDETLYPPFAVGDSIAALTRRMGGISEGGTVALVPGWDWEVIMCGIAGAIARYQDGLGKSKGIVARAAVGEGLWWFAAADEFLRKRVSGGMSLAAYSAEIQKTSAGRRFAGLIFLRNRAGHQLAAVLMQYYYAKTSVDTQENDGSVRPLTIVANALAHLSLFEDSPDEGYYFAPSPALPSPDVKYEEKFNRDACYDELVAERRVIDVFDTVQRSLIDAVSFQWTNRNVHISVNGGGILPSSADM
jgi:hypothetical protein